MKFEKSQIELYRFRDGHAWADISIDADGNKGRISISSDYGNWANYWGFCGVDFKGFLCELNIDYFAGKIGCGNYFDFDKTIREWKSLVLEIRRDDGIDAEYARCVFDEIKGIEDRSGRSREGVISWVSHSGAILEFFNHAPELYTIIDPLFRRFWNEVWPHFVNELKNEKELSPCPIN